MNDALLNVKDLTITFQTERGELTAVDHLSFDLGRKETLCIVGESGSGKSVTALSIMGLLPQPAGRVTNGSIRFQGQELTGLTNKQMQGIRGNRISMIFQEPMTSLNPVYTVGYQISEVLKKHKGMNTKEAMRYAAELLERVGIPEPGKRVHSFPHELSGGLRQRVMIAMALSCDPDILIADEPTTALDVTIQAQILRLMETLKQDLDMSIIFITHDLGVVSQISDRTIVMYGGMKMEERYADGFFDHVQHPYTVDLLGCIPTSSLSDGKLMPIPGMIPSLANMPGGCRFSNRCRRAMSACHETIPELREIEPGHWIACHLEDKEAVL